MLSRPLQVDDGLQAAPAHSDSTPPEKRWKHVTYRNIETHGFKFSEWLCGRQRLLYLRNCSMILYFSMISVEGLAIASKLSVILEGKNVTLKLSFMQQSKKKVTILK